MSEKGKEHRNKKGCISEEVDRLGDLPYHILHHILSFLETQYAVRTSLLSKKWSNLWTTIPVLNLNSDSFSRLTDFEEFVLKVFDKRDPSSALSTFRFNYRGLVGDRLKKKIINYAFTHKVTNLFLEFGSRPCVPLELQALKTLQLTACAGITTLHLHCLSFSAGASDCCDFFECFPNLNKLWLSHCDFRRFKIVKISGPQLLSLTIIGMRYDIKPTLHNDCMVEISAPKLTFFCYKDSNLMNFSVIHLPFLQHAHIDVFPSRPYHPIVLKQSLFKLFRALCNAQFLSLTHFTVQALNNMPGIEHQPNPLSRLKSLKLITPCKSGRQFPVPVKVANYLLNGSPCAEYTFDDVPVKRGYFVVLGISERHSNRLAITADNCAVDLPTLCIAMFEGIAQEDPPCGSMHHLIMEPEDPCEKLLAVLSPWLTAEN